MLPDARFVRGANGTLAAFSSPTERYDHAVLGDGLEADNMTLLRAGDEQNLEAGFVAPASGGVFEGIAPLWFEMPGIEGELLAVMESTVESATRLSVYGLDGSLLAAGPYIGEPYKWRHLLAVGPFGPNGGDRAGRHPHTPYRWDHRVLPAKLRERVPEHRRHPDRLHLTPHLHPQPGHGPRRRPRRRWPLGTPRTKRRLY